MQQKSDYKSIASTPGMPTLKKNLDNKDIPMIDKLRNSLHISHIMTNTSKVTTILQYFKGKRSKYHQFRNT